MSRITFILFSLLLLASLPAMAQNYYRWVDDEGKVHYGQAVPPEFKDYGYVRLSADGTIKERVEPALSPEEIAERRRERAEQAKREAEQRTRASRDKLLLATYRNEQALEEAMQMQLTGIDSQRQSTRNALVLIERRFETLVGRAARLNRRGEPVPEDLSEGIEESRGELRRLRAELEALDERERETRARYREDLERYRELTGSTDGA